MAIQDGLIANRNYQNKWTYNKWPETIEHIISINRKRTTSGATISFLIYNKYVPVAIMESDEYKLY